MYKYVGDISKIAHNIVLNYLDSFDVAIDATLGNGHDTDFLVNHFGIVYSFDIQKIACQNYSNKNISNVNVINDSHENFKLYINKPVDLIMYNLGFLPGANKDITTNHLSTIKSIKSGLEILNNGGFIAICVYPGHNEGIIESSCISDLIESLPKNEFGVMVHKFANRSSSAPYLVIIEKNHANIKE